MGTLVGAFLGVQVAVAGTHQAPQQAAAAIQKVTEANAKADRAIQQLPPEIRADFR